MQASINYIRKELEGLYPDEEIESFIRILFQHLKNYSLTDLILNQHQPLDTGETRQIEMIVDRLKAHEPIQYILGETEFYGLPFQLTPDVLIPRPETEELVEWIIKTASAPNLRILDVGTGSGCIPISLKKHLPGADIMACDISEKALKVAQANALTNQAAVHFFKMDILHPKTPDFFNQIDLLVSNPPYVTESEKRQMQANVLQFEPENALFVPDQYPLVFYEALVQFASDHLAIQGKVFWEINEAFGNECEILLKENGFTNVQLKKDLNGKDRMIFAERSKC